MTSPAIELQAIATFDERLAPVEGLDLRVQTGEIFGLIGPRGSGKSTLMKVLATLRPPAGGRAIIAGFNLAEQPAEVRRAIGYVPDFFGIYDDLKVGEMLRFYARAYDLEENVSERRIADLLAKASLGGRVDDRIERLDREAKHRLQLVRVLLHDPQVLLLDDPALGLSPPARERLGELIREIGNEGKTILLGGNLLSDVAPICDRLAVLHEGRKLAEGNAREIADKLTPGRMIEVKPAATDQAEPIRKLLGADVRVLQAELHAGNVVFNLREGRTLPAPVIEEAVRQGAQIAAYREHGINVGMFFQEAVR